MLQNSVAQRASLLPRALTIDVHAPLEDIPHTGTRSKRSTQAKSISKVHFAQQDSDREDGHPRQSSSPHSSCSDLSARSSFDEPPLSPASPVIEAIVPRLSFWNKIAGPAQSLSQTLLPVYAKGKTKGKGSKSKPTDSALSAHLSGAESEHEDPSEIERLIHEKKAEPSEVLKNVLAAFTLQPASQEERHTELETKIVRECVRSFSKGEMYFAYTFGGFCSPKVPLINVYSLDITRSLQHKQDRLSKSRKEYTLLAELDALPGREPPLSPQSTQRLDRVSASGEPYPSLPLWRRVDKQFWWNEWLSKPFMDAGVWQLFFFESTHHHGCRSYMATFCPSCKVITRLQRSAYLPNHPYIHPPVV